MECLHGKTPYSPDDLEGGDRKGEDKEDRLILRIRMMNDKYVTKRNACRPMLADDYKSPIGRAGCISWNAL